MPAKSQDQARLMNWVHAIQKGEATGPKNVRNIANEMDPSDTEHFMNRGHINKRLPKRVKEAACLNMTAQQLRNQQPVFDKNQVDPRGLNQMTNQMAFQRGFKKRAAQHGLSEVEANKLLQIADFNLENL